MAAVPLTSMMILPIFSPPASMSKKTLMGMTKQSRRMQTMLTDLSDAAEYYSEDEME